MRFYEEISKIKRRLDLCLVDQGMTATLFTLFEPEAGGNECNKMLS